MAGIFQFSLERDGIHLPDRMTCQVNFAQQSCASCTALYVDQNELTLHHDFLPLSNGHLIVLGSAAQDFTDLPGYPGTIQVIGDLLVDLDRNWDPVWFWSAFDHLNVNRHLDGTTTEQIGIASDYRVAEYLVSSQKGGSARVEFGIDASYGMQTAWYSVPQGGSRTAILVAGMKASTTYYMRLEVHSGKTSWFDKDRLFTTGPLPSMKFPISVITRSASVALGHGENPGVELINLTEPIVNMIQAVVTDRDGNPIWYYDVGADQANLPTPIKLIPNGHMLINIQSGTTGATWLREIDLA